jgi:hypothetical protein
VAAYQVDEAWTFMGVFTLLNPTELRPSGTTKLVLISCLILVQ